jgi:hypothetical protein
MRHSLLRACVLAGCAGSGGDDMPQPGDGTCPLPMSIADTGALTAVKAQMCNYPMSMGMQHWYRLSATLSGAPTDVLQIELYDKIGAFAGTTVHTGTFPVDTNPLGCGVCVRGLGDKAGPTAKEYFASAGMVTVSMIGGDGTPIVASVSGVSFVELDGGRKVVASGCTASVAGAQISGTVMQMGGTGVGTGGAGMCPAAADPARARRCHRDGHRVSTAVRPSPELADVPVIGYGRDTPTTFSFTRATGVLGDPTGT